MFKPPEYYMNNQLKKERNWLVFGENELNEENERAQSVSTEYPEKIWAIRKKTEIYDYALEAGSLSPKSEKDPNKKTIKKEEKETREYFRTYRVQFGQDIDEDDEESLEFEGFIVCEHKTKKSSKPKT